MKFFSRNICSVFVVASNAVIVKNNKPVGRKWERKRGRAKKSAEVTEWIWPQLFISYVSFILLPGEHLHIAWTKWRHENALLSEIKMSVCVCSQYISGLILLKVNDYNKNTKKNVAVGFDVFTRFFLSLNSSNRLDVTKSILKNTIWKINQMFYVVINELAA